MRWEWNADELVGSWTLVGEDWQLIGNKSGATRLGFAVLRAIDVLPDGDRRRCALFRYPPADEHQATVSAKAGGSAPRTDPAALVGSLARWTAR